MRPLSCGRHHVCVCVRVVWTLGALCRLVSRETEKGTAPFWGPRNVLRGAGRMANPNPGDAPSSPHLPWCMAPDLPGAALTSGPLGRERIGPGTSARQQKWSLFRGDPTRFTW